MFEKDDSPSDEWRKSDYYKYKDSKNFKNSWDKDPWDRQYIADSVEDNPEYLVGSS